MTWTLTLQVGAVVAVVAGGAYLYARHIGTTFDRRYGAPRLRRPAE